jgi:hypothetical protein
MENIGTTPEWVAAIALLGQAGIFVWQTRVFRHHAKSQQLIGKVLQEQAGIMSRQVEIAAEAGRFTRRTAIKEERARLFDSILSMKTMVVSAIEKTKVSSESKAGVVDMNAAWESLANQCTTCQKELITCIHIPPELKNYFLQYAVKAAAIVDRRPTGSANAQPLIDLNAEYKDYGKKMIDAAQTPIDV